MTRPATSRIDKLLASIRYSSRADIARMVRCCMNYLSRGFKAHPGFIRAKYEPPDFENGDGEP